MSRRTERLGSLIQQEIANMIQRDLNDQIQANAEAMNLLRFIGLWFLVCHRHSLHLRD